MRIALFVAFVALSGCEKKDKTNTPSNPGGGGAGGGAGGATGGATVGGVRPPTADDLAVYTKELAGTGKLMARIETPVGTINCELFGDKAPMTVANFVGLAIGKKPFLDPESRQEVAGKPYFDGLIFHRVIPGFMIQGGDPTGSGRGGPGYRFGDEFADGLEMGPGALAMANAGPSTNGSQFFIMEGSAPGLVGKHTIFGQCKEIEVVKKITALRGPGDRPTEPVTMKVTIARGN